MSEFVYPMIGLCGLSVFLGTFIGNTEGVSAFQVAMTRCCATFVSLFGGFFFGFLFDKPFRSEDVGKRRRKGIESTVCRICYGGYVCAGYC